MKWFALIAALTLATALPAQTLPPGPQVLSFYSPLDDTDQPYAIYIPDGYNPARPWPLVVSLHGAFSNHRVNLRRVFGQGNRPGESDAEAMRYFPALPSVPFLVASPLARGTMGYRGVAESDVWAMLADVKKRFNVDEERTYLTGLSMGGGGTLELGLKRPDVWAAIVPLCPVPPAFDEHHAGNALNVPVHFHHGVDDKVVPVTVSRHWSKLMREAGVQVEVKEYPGVQHNVWDPAYQDAGLFKWLSQHRRQRFPDRVLYASADPFHSTAYWVRFDKFEPGSTARIDARFTAPNRVEVRAWNLPAFSLHLDGHPRYNPKQEFVIVINGEERRFAAGAALQIGEPAPAPPLVRHVTSRRHIYVYGTADNPPPPERARRRDLAAQAADWSGGGRRLFYLPRVVSDREVRPSDLEGNLILFGNAKTNRLVAGLGAQAPVALRDGHDATHGLIYAVPGQKPGTVTVVHQGLPWWQGGERTQRGGYNFLPLQHRILMSIDQFLLFRGAVSDVLAEGFLDQKRAALPTDIVEVQ
jgi:pimeloyl-ACP methyl ester carboxylesterase